MRCQSDLFGVSSFFFSQKTLGLGVVCLYFLFIPLSPLSAFLHCAQKVHIVILKHFAVVKKSESKMVVAHSNFKDWDHNQVE